MPILSMEDALKNPFLNKVENTSIALLSKMPHQFVEKPRVPPVLSKGFSWIYRFSKNYSQFVAIDGDPGIVYPGLCVDHCFESPTNLVEYFGDKELEYMTVSMIHCSVGP